MKGIKAEGKKAAVYHTYLDASRARKISPRRKEPQLAPLYHSVFLPVSTGFHSPKNIITDILPNCVVAVSKKISTDEA